MRPIQPEELQHIGDIFARRCDEAETDLQDATSAEERVALEATRDAYAHASHLVGDLLLRAAR